MDWQSSCADLKKLPHYNAIMKSFLFKHIKEMLTELFTEVGEEALILSVNPVTGAMSRLGTIAGQAFLEDRDPLLSQFLSFCVKRTSKYIHERENIRKGKRKAVEITIESPNPAKIQKQTASKTDSANQIKSSDLEVKDKLASKIKDRLAIETESNESDSEIGNRSPESAVDKSLLKNPTCVQNAGRKSSSIEKASVSPCNENENISVTSNQNVSQNENIVKRNSNDKNEAKCIIAKNTNRQEICSQEKQTDLGEKDRPERQSSVERSGSEDLTLIPTKAKMKGREQLSSQGEQQTSSAFSNEGMNVSDYEIKREIDINDYEAGFNGNDGMEWTITVNNPDSTASDVTQDYDLNITGYDEKSLVENESGMDKGGPDILKNSKKNKSELSSTEIPSATATSSQISTEEDMKVDLDMVKIEPMSPTEPLSDEDIPTGELSEEDVPARNTPSGSKDLRTNDDDCFDEYLKEGHTDFGFEDDAEVERIPEAIPRPNFSPVYLYEDQSPTFITFDLVTTDLIIRGPYFPQLTQIAATELISGSVFSCYVKPTIPISESAQQATGISMAGTGEMIVKGKLVEIVSIQKALKDFSDWIGTFSSPVLIANNGKRYDFPVLFNAVEKLGFTYFCENLIALIDSFFLFKKYLPNANSYKIEDLANSILGVTYPHNPIDDVKNLARLVVHLNLKPAEIMKFSFTTTAILLSLKANKEKHENIESLRPLMGMGIMKHTTADNIASSGLNLGHLKKIYEWNGEDGLMVVFTGMNSEGQPRVTNVRKVLDHVIPKLAQYFDSMPS